MLLLSHHTVFLIKRILIGKFYLIVFCFVTFGLEPCNANAAPAKPELTIARLLDGESELNPIIEKFFTDEITRLLANEYTLTFPPDARIVGDYSGKSIDRGLKNLLARQDINLIVCLGFISSHRAASLSSLTKPVIAPFVLNATAQKFPANKEGSGKKNFNYISFRSFIDDDIVLFQKLTAFTRVAIVADNFFLDEIPGVFNDIAQTLQKKGIDHTPIPLDPKATNNIAATIPNDVDAVYLAPLFRVGLQQQRLAIEQLQKRGIPVFSMLALGESSALLSGKSSDDFERLFRRTALNAQRIANGEPAAKIPLDFTVNRQLRLQQAAAGSLGISPPWDVLAGIEVVRSPEDSGKNATSLPEAIMEAQEKNLAFAISQTRTAVADNSVTQSWTNFLPSISLNLQQLTIDADRAAASLGTQPENSLVGQASVKQLLFSDRAIANIRIQNHLHNQRKWATEEHRLNLIEQTVEAYLNHLRAKVLVSVQEEAAKTTTAHLNTARKRMAIGTVDAAEVHRWEYELSIAEQKRLQAKKMATLSALAINALLHRPQIVEFHTTEFDLDDTLAMSYCRELLNIVQSDADVERLSQFLIAGGIEKSVELKQIQLGIDAKTLELGMIKRSSLIPEVGLAAQISKTFRQGGEGTVPLRQSAATSLPPQYAPLAGIFPEAKDTLDWHIGLGVSLDIFDGGSKLVAISRAVDELRELKQMQELAIQGIELKIRSALQSAMSSFAEMQLAEKAYTAADKGRESASDAYAKGMITLLDLLDVQTAARVAKEQEANASYSFLLDLTRVQRATGDFAFLLNEHEKITWLEQVKTFVHGAKQ